MYKFTFLIFLKLAQCYTEPKYMFYVEIEDRFDIVAPKLGKSKVPKNKPFEDCLFQCTPTLDETEDPVASFHCDYDLYIDYELSSLRNQLSEIAKSKTGTCGNDIELYVVSITSNAAHAGGKNGDIVDFHLPKSTRIDVEKLRVKAKMVSVTADGNSLLNVTGDVTIEADSGVDLDLDRFKVNGNMELKLKPTHGIFKKTVPTVTLKANSAEVRGKFDMIGFDSRSVEFVGSWDIPHGTEAEKDSNEEMGRPRSNAINKDPRAIGDKLRKMWS